MIRLFGVGVGLDFDGDVEGLRGVVGRVLGVPVERVLGCRVVRRGVDARRRGDVRLALTVDVTVAGDERAVLRRCGHPQAKLVDGVGGTWTPGGVAGACAGRVLARQPVVVGAGPAGLFAAYVLAKAGAQPLLVERGCDVEARQAHVAAFWRGEGLLDHSNVQFGEGGAGTFSDGKLNTGIKDPRCGYVLETFVAFGAPAEIAYQAKPHIGTDLLAGVVRRMREEIVALGGTVRFETQLTGLCIEAGALRGVVLAGEERAADAVILAIGHSARDTYKMLRDAGIGMQLKPFSIGARIEHPQALIDTAQYGRFAGHPALGAADDRLATRVADGRGAYTFCMCPGGSVIASASEPGGVVTNGMSSFARDGENANSALLVDVRPEDLPDTDPLAGVAFQRRWERLAFQLGGGGYRAPAQRVDDFLAGRPSHTLGGVTPSYRPGVVPAALRDCLPTFVTDAMAQAIVTFDRQLHGFALADAVLTGVETRSSSPLRILRGADGQATIGGLYPTGEGAGYAGGILSAAVDGIRAAERLLENNA